MPVPSEDILLRIVGAEEVPQHTPRAVTADPPSEVTLPPVVAEVAEIYEGAMVVINPTDMYRNCLCSVIN